jgi:hypothetical protein
MVAEQLPDNSELRVDVLLEGIESYRGMDVQRGFRLTFFHSTIDRRFRARITCPRPDRPPFSHAGRITNPPLFFPNASRGKRTARAVTQRQGIVIGGDFNTNHD